MPIVSSLLLLLSKNRNSIALVWQNRVMSFDAEIKENRNTIYIVRGLAATAAATNFFQSRYAKLTPS